MRLNSWLVIIFLTGLSLLLGGHTLGINQDAYYLPLLFPGPNDLYRQSLNQYVTWFYPLINFFAAYFGLPLVWFIFHLISIFMFILGLVLLSRVLFAAALPGYLAAIFLMLPKFSLGGIMVGINHGYLYQSFFVFPFGLVALWLFWRRRELFAFSLLGLLANFHSLTAIHLLAWFGLSLCLEKKFRLAILGLVGFLIFALPVIWQNLPTGLLPSVSLADWLAFNRLRSGHHLFPFTWDWLTWLKGLWPLLGLVFLRRRLALLNLSALILFIFALVGTEIFPNKFIIQLQFFRLSMFLLVLGYLGLAAAIIRLPRKFCLPLIVILGLLTLHLPPKISSFDQDWLAAQVWLRDNTAPASRLYLLPFLPTFRPFSLRSHNLVWPETTVGIVNDQVVARSLQLLADYQLDWRALGSASPVITAKLKDKARSLPPEAILQLARAEAADFLVLPADWSWPARPVYQNGSFQVISLE